MSFDTHFSSSPYPGLRPFEPEECDIFFGREGQTDELLARLQKHRFVAVVGPSGCGKSSLVYAGMIPALKTGFICDAGPDWRILQMRPGERPMGHLAAALLAWHNAAGEIDAGARLLAEAALRRGPLGLVELARETKLCDGANLLVLVDQFEELFRFREKVDPDDADAFVALLLATAAQKELPIYIVITMRSDFLGDCAIFHGLPEVINESQYLTPRLTREQCSDAICGPARVFGGDVDEKLLNRLLNDFGPDPDQLPVLQHALMRMWQRHVALAPAGGAAGRIVLTLDDYQSPEIGGLRHALSRHGEEVMRELTAEQQRIAQFLFRRLTERGKGRRDTRSPARLEEVAAIAGVGIGDIKPVVDVFRRADRSFLMPRVGEPLQPDTFLDIGHESLIRQWDTLAQWMDEEAESAEVYIRLKETARLWKADRAALWGTPDLERALEWRCKIQPGTEPVDSNSLEAWASRYGSTDDLRLAQEFLAASQEKYRRDLEELEEANRRTIRRARLAAFGFAVTAIVVIAGVLLYFYLYSWDHAAFYNRYVKVRGAPQGIGELSSEQVKRRPMSLKIVRRGRLGPVLRAEAVDRKGEPTREHYIGTYLKASGEGGKPEDVRWEFTYDSNDRVVQETAYDLRGNRVWGFVYVPQKGENENFGSAYFVGSDGYPKPEKEYAGNVVHIEYDANGYERVLRYRSRGLKPARGPDKVFGRRLEYDNGNITKLVSLGPDDQPLNDEYGNAILEITRIDSMGNSTEEVARDASGEVTVTTQGWSFRKSAFDSAGNLIEQSYFGPSGEPVHNTEGFHRMTWSRDDRGNVVEIRYQDSGGSPAPGEGGCFGWVREFDSRDNPIRGRCLGSDGQPAFHAQGYAIWTAQYDANRNVVDMRYFDPPGNPALVSMGYARVTYRYDDKFGKALEVAYYSTDGSPAVSNEGIARIVREYDGHGRMSKEAYYGIDGKLTPSDKGYAFAEWGYDAHGNISRIRHFGSDGKQAIGGDDGIAGWKARHDAGGRQIEVIYLDSSDKPMVSNKGVAGFRSEYDEAGNQTQYSYIGLRGEACLQDGVAGWISSFDPLGKELERKYLGPGGEPAPHKEGYARWTARRDARGNLTEIGYYDTRGKSVMVPWQSGNSGQPDRRGRARAVYKYNAQSRLTEEAYFGTDGKPASTKEGWARATHAYDHLGNKIKTRYYGSGTSPIQIDGGYYSVGWRYNHQRKAVETEYFSRKEELVSSVDGYARATWEYDLFGRLVEAKLFDTERKPTAHRSEGVYKRVRRYNPRGQEIETDDYGIDGKPVLNRKNGCHILKFDYDQRTRMVEERCLGKNRELTVNQEWRAARVKFTYDAQGRLSSEDYFDENKTSVGNWRYRYDSYGKLVDKSWNQAVKPMGPSVDGSQRP